MQRNRRAVTLIEILIAISLIALLLGLLAPAMFGARSSARNASCIAMQRNLHIAVATYAINHRDRLPGVNTTGREYLGDGSLNITELLFDTTPETPTTVFDWISPAIGLSAGLSPNRARRTKQIFEDLGCASAGAMNDMLWPSGANRPTNNTADYAQFRELLREEGIGQISYLSPGPFHLLGPHQQGLGRPRQGRHYGWAGPAIPHHSYRPRMDRVGAQPATKIFLADGTRYVTPERILDFDVSPRPKYYGSFTSSTPIYDASTAYGRRPHRPEFGDEGRGENRSSYPLNRDLSYRHGRRINVLYFDGHAGSLTEAESKTDAAPWYPTGSIFTGVRATEESRTRHVEGERLH
ncbi:MAG: hypothetical protein EA376_01400 [Phycisphaeraceae bacterium]|nr:MAG: hypothetical protein EA376_01400 [Phycisphaeraceae bacterium]